MESVWTKEFDKVADLQTIANDNQVVIVVNLEHDTNVLVCNCTDDEDKDAAVENITEKCDMPTLLGYCFLY